jgi:hypothetical protein
MKIFSKLSVSLLATFAFTLSANAGWMMVNEDGSMVPYTADCCKVVKHVKKKKVCRKKTCSHCDYSKFPLAETMPVEPGEHLRPARLGFCGKK